MSETQHVGKLYGKKYKQKKSLSEIIDSKKNINNKRKTKWRNIFIKTIVFLMFLFILFIIPGIIRSIMISNSIFDENIILRLVVLILALLSLIAGVIKIMSPAKK